eukprot:scaffold34309_cov27-Tisochrysis_lutea.AAC.5
MPHTSLAVNLGGSEIFFEGCMRDFIRHKAVYTWIDSNKGSGMSRDLSCEPAGSNTTSMWWCQKFAGRQLFEKKERSAIPCRLPLDGRCGRNRRDGKELGAERLHTCNASAAQMQVRERHGGW